MFFNLLRKFLNLFACNSDNIRQTFLAGEFLQSTKVKPFSDVGPKEEPPETAGSSRQYCIEVFQRTLSWVLMMPRGSSFSDDR